MVTQSAKIDILRKMRIELPHIWRAFRILVNFVLLIIAVYIAIHATDPLGLLKALTICLTSFFLG